jgi:hypothetical protein
MEPFEVVSISDSALKDVGYTQMRLYELSRNLEDLPASVWSLADPPTVFKCKPLTTQWESVALSLDASAIRTLVREHVVNITRGRTTKHQDFGWDRGKLDEDSMGKIPLSICSELAAVVIQSQNRVPGGDIPFSPTSQPSYLQDRDHTKLRTRLAQTVAATEAEIASGAKESE